MNNLNQHKTKKYYFSIILGHYLTFRLLVFSILVFCFSFLLSANPNAIQIESIRFNDSVIMGNVLQEKIDTYGIFYFDKLLELEVFLEQDSSEIDTFFYQIASIDGESEWRFTTYPVIRYTNLPTGINDLFIHHSSGKDTLMLLLNTDYPAIDTSVPWWLQPLLIFCLMLIPFTIVYFVALNRFRRSLRVANVRNEIASDLHDDLGANLSAINNLTELLGLETKSKLSTAANEIIDEIQIFTKETLDNFQDTIWSIKPEYDSVEILLDRMKHLSERLLKTKNIQLHFDNNYKPAFQHQLEMLQKQNLFSAFKEVLNNIIKHSEADKVHIQINSTRRNLSIEVKDNGTGFDYDRLDRKSGLKHLAARTAEHFIDFKLESTIGKGTMIRFAVDSIH